MSLQDLVRLGDVVNLKRGYDLPTSSRIDGPYPVISSSGPTGLHSEFKVHPPGVVIGRYGTLGEVFLVETPFWPLNTTLYVEDFRGNDERWVAALLESLHLEQLLASSAVPGINRNHLHLLEVPQPCIEDQVLIGRCLRLFDDLIENNRRRIELLEETARLLYREWFVHFRYSGHEDLPLVDSELGPIPGDWEICRVDQVMGVVGGGTPSKKEEDYWTDGEIQWFTPSDLTKTGSMFALESGLKINELGLAKSSANLFPAGSVMMTSRATIGVLSFSTTEACTNQGFITCLPSERLSGGHIYLWLEANVPLFLQISTGATFKELTKSTFRKLLVAVPPIPLENEFCSLVEPLLQSVLNLLQQQRVLQASRDLLLPRLVSGDLDVSDFELDLEAVG